MAYRSRNRSRRGRSASRGRRVSSRRTRRGGGTSTVRIVIEPGHAPTAGSFPLGMKAAEAPKKSKF